MLPWSSHKFNINTDVPSQKGKTVIVTGGNSGLGLESVRHLARAGAKVYMCSRSLAKADAAVSSIQSDVPTATIHVLELDLASLESVKAAAQKFLSENERLDILMLNAGIMAVPEGLTADGFEIQFGTNYVAHAALAKLLLPLLVRTAQQPGSDVRVVSLTSIGHQWFAPAEGMLLDQVTGTMAEHGAWVRYGHSKRANIYFAKGLAKRYPQILSVAVHPGGVKGTGLAVTARATDKSIRNMVSFAVMRPFLVEVQEGVRGQLWASVAPREEVGSGKVYYPMAKEHKGSAMMNSEKQVDALWDWTEKELTKKGF